VAPVITDVSEEFIVSFIELKRINELGVNGNSNWQLVVLIVDYY
jgi:hypothetical protein